MTYNTVQKNKNNLATGTTQELVYVVPSPLMASDVLEMKDERRCDADKRSISVVICNTNIITIPEAHLRLIITITTTTITTTIDDDVPATIPMTAVLESV